MTKLEQALAWARRGFRVFPLHVDSKVPVWTDFPARATTNEAEVRAAWSDPVLSMSLDYNIGAVPSGQLMVDLDRKDGLDGVRDFQALGLPFDTMTVQTPTGGLHVWYSAPPTANSAKKVGPGIDTRGPGGFAVMPGSTIDGVPYQLVLDLPLQPAPAVILDKLRAPRDRATDQAAMVELDTPSSIALAQEFLGREPVALPGQRNDAAFRIAAHLRDLGVSELMAIDLMLSCWIEHTDTAIPAEELPQIVENAYTFAQNAPGCKHPMASFEGVVPAPDLPPLPPLQGHQLALFPDANPFACFGNLTPAAQLPPRRWVIHRMLERGSVTGFIAPGGVGKSQLLLTIAVLLAIGQENIFGFDNHVHGTPQYSVIFNAEDSKDEMSARVHALCTAMNVDPDTVAPYIALISGKDVRLRIMAVEDGRACMPAEAQRLVGHMINACLSKGAVFLGADPMTKLHNLNENDNIAMGTFLENMNRIAELANVALGMAHHMAKPGFAASSPYAGNAGAGRGAGEIINGTRATFTLSSPTEEDKNRYGLTPERARRLLRLDDAKLNHGLSGGEPAWLEKVSIRLSNGEEVGAFLPAEPETDTDSLKRAMAQTIYAEMTAKGSGSVTLTEAAILLGRGDGVYTQLTQAQCKNRIERFLARGVETENGQVLTIAVGSNNSKTVVIQT